MNRGHRPLHNALFTLAARDITTSATVPAQRIRQPAAVQVQEGLDQVGQGRLRPCGDWQGVVTPIRSRTPCRRLRELRHVRPELGSR